MCVANLSPKKPPPWKPQSLPKFQQCLSEGFVHVTDIGWMYQLYAMFEDPAIVGPQYGISDTTGLGVCGGGIPIEGTGYGAFVVDIWEALMALETAGITVASNSPRKILLCSMTNRKSTNNRGTTMHDTLHKKHIKSTPACVDRRAMHGKRLEYGSVHRHSGQPRTQTPSSHIPRTRPQQPYALASRFCCLVLSLAAFFYLALAFHHALTVCCVFCDSVFTAAPRNEPWAELMLNSMVLTMPTSNRGWQQGSAMQALVARFGDGANRLAAALPRFSLDLVDMVASYAFAWTVAPRLDALPVMMREYASKQLGWRGCATLACCPNGTVWAADTHFAHVFSQDGVHLRSLRFPFHPRSIAFFNERVWIVDAQRRLFFGGLHEPGSAYVQRDCRQTLAVAAPNLQGNEVGGNSNCRWALVVRSDGTHGIDAFDRSEFPTVYYDDACLRDSLAIAFDTGGARLFALAHDGVHVLATFFGGHYSDSECYWLRKMVTAGGGADGKADALAPPDLVAIAIDASGQALVADASNACVHVLRYDARSRTQRVTRLRFGGRRPRALCVDARGWLHVAFAATVRAKACVRAYAFSL